MFIVQKDEFGLKFYPIIIFVGIFNAQIFITDIIHINIEYRFEFLCISLALSLCLLSDPDTRHNYSYLDDMQLKCSLCRIRNHIFKIKTLIKILCAFNIKRIVCCFRLRRCFLVNFISKLVFLFSLKRDGEDL